MSLTLHPVNSSIFIKPELMSSSHHRVHSLESLHNTDKDRLTGRWLDAWPRITNKASNRLICESATALGTTFPPRTGMGEHFKGNMRLGEIETCSSAPDLTPLSINSDDLDDFGPDHDDDDHLFEFDMSPEREILDTDTVNDTAESGLPELRRSFSDGSCGRVDDVDSKAGFSSIFGSTSSGLGSERRLSQDNGLCELEEGKSFEPSAWRDYMNERLSSEGTSTPISEGTPEPMDSGVPTEGSATPILSTVSTSPTTSPLISPDSLLEGQHLDEHLFITHSEDSCPRCDLDASDVSDEQKNSSSASSVIESSPNPHRLKEGELAQLLDQLEDDRRGYPGVASEISCSSNSTLSNDDLGEITPIRKSSTDDEFVTPKLRKCSSLKSGRTPPGTPSQRKIVRFADIFGLDLSEVKTFTDEIPKIPRCAFQDLDVDIGEYDIGSPRTQTPVFKPNWAASTPEPKVSSTSLVPMFTQPGCNLNFYDTVMTKKICLENAYMEEPFTVCGIVRVLNIDFNKSVTVRWTVNDWNTQNDMPATYVDGSSDGMTDKFSFRITLGCLPVGSRLQFCLKYDVKGNQHWDNNNGGNYVFQVFLNSNSPGGSGGVTYRSSPMSISASSLSRRSFPTYQSYHQSPSYHGDDPWSRFM